MREECKVNMTSRRLPVEGSVQGDTGTCPECETPGVLLSIVGGFVRKHVIAPVAVPENNPQPATLVKAAGKKRSTGLSEPVVSLTDTGVRVGDPRTAEQRRVVEIEGAAGTGTVQVPRKVEGETKTKSGKPRMVTKLVDVPATEEHVREALDYWRKRRVTSDSSRARQNAMVTSLARRLESIMAVQTVLYNPATRALDVTGAVRVADQGELSAAKDAAQVHRGPTLVRGRDVPPRVREAGLSWEEPTDLRANGEVRKVTTFEQPLGRERFDRKITDVPEPAPKRSAAERNRWRKAQRAKFMSKGK